MSNYINFNNSLSRTKKKPGLKTRALVMLLSGLGIINTGLLLYNYFFFQGQCQVLPWGLNLLGSDCGIVTQSTYGVIMGIPLSLWGLIGYTLILTFTFLSFSNKSYYWIALLFSIWGFLISWILTGIQYFLIETYCPLCLLSMVIMNLITLLLLFGIIPIQPQFISKDKVTLSFMLAGLITLTGLLGFKILEDTLVPTTSVNRNFIPKKNQSPPTSLYNFPAGTINDSIIHLNDIDNLLKKHLSSQQWETLTQNKEKYKSTLNELRKRGLYFLGIEHLSTIEGLSSQQLVNTAIGKNIKWTDFISQYFPIDKMLTTQNTTNDTLVSQVNTEMFEKITQYLSNRTTVKENIFPFQFSNQ